MEFSQELIKLLNPLNLEKTASDQTIGTEMRKLRRTKDNFSDEEFCDANNTLAQAAANTISATLMCLGSTQAMLVALSGAILTVHANSAATIATRGDVPKVPIDMLVKVLAKNVMTNLAEIVQDRMDDAEYAEHIEGVMSRAVQMAKEAAEAKLPPADAFNVVDEAIKKADSETKH